MYPMWIFLLLTLSGYEILAGPAHTGHAEDANEEPEDDPQIRRPLPIDRPFPAPAPFPPGPGDDW